MLKIKTLILYGNGSLIIHAYRVGVVEHTPVLIASVSKGVMWIASRLTAFTVPRTTGCPRYLLTAGLTGTPSVRPVSVA